MPVTADNAPEWFAMRDLTRPNAKCPAYARLAAMGLEVFTPLHSVVRTKNGKRVREEVPVVHDLLFVRSAREPLDAVVAGLPTLQYRFVRGGAYREALIVPAADMDRFIGAVRAAADSLRYYLPSEITPAMIGRAVRIAGGPFEGYAGHLLSLRGARKKRLMVSLPGIITAAVEVETEYIQFV